MGHDEDKNNFDGGTTPVSPNPRAQLANNRLGMRPSRNLSAMDELNRITEEERKQQAPASETGDIVLNNGGAKQPKDKKFYIIIVLAILTVAVFAFGFFMTNGKGINLGGGASGGADDSKLSDLISQYGDKVISNEEFFREASNGDLVGREIFIEASNKEILENFEAAKNFSGAIQNISSVKEDVKESFEKLKGRMVDSLSAYEKSIDIYNNYYEAITSSNLQKIEQYANSSVATEKGTAEAFTRYIGNKEIISSLEKQMDDYKCSNEGLTGYELTSCGEFYLEYVGKTEAMNDNAYIATIFSDSRDISNSELSTSTLINAIKGAFEE